MEDSKIPCGSSRINEVDIRQKRQKTPKISDHG
jgi:hypothetical protein